MRKLIWPTYGGVYKILNVMNGKVYVGSAANFKSRWKFHLGQLRYGNHHSITLQRAYNKYGERNFMFVIIEVIKDKTKLKEREQIWKDFYKSYDPRYGYDICPKAENCLGVKHTPETCAKRSVATKRNWANPECRERIMTNLKKSLSDPEYKSKMAKITKKMWENPELRKKMLDGQNNRKPLSTETKNKIAFRNREIAKDPEWRAKVSASNKGKVRSEEARANMSIAQKGRPRKPHSAETKAKIAKAAHKRWANPKFQEKMKNIMDSKEYHDKISKSQKIRYNKQKETKQ